MPPPLNLAPQKSATKKIPFQLQLLNNQPSCWFGWVFKTPFKNIKTNSKGATNQIIIAKNPPCFFLPGGFGKKTNDDFFPPVGFGR